MYNIQYNTLEDMYSMQSLVCQYSIQFDYDNVVYPLQGSKSCTSPPSHNHSVPASCPDGSHLYGGD